MSEQEQISVAEALRELKRLDALITKRASDITRYCSKRRNTKDEIDKQEQYVKEQFQSAMDLLERYKTIKMKVQMSNLTTFVTFKDKSYSIAELILYKQGLTDKYALIYNAHTDRNAIRQITDHQNSIGIRQGTVNALDDSGRNALDLIPELYYDERKVQILKEDLLELRTLMDALIDKSNVNTTIDL